MCVCIQDSDFILVVLVICCAVALLCLVYHPHRNEGGERIRILLECSQDTVYLRPDYCCYRSRVIRKFHLGERTHYPRSTCRVPCEPRGSASMLGSLSFVTPRWGERKRKPKKKEGEKRKRKREREKEKRREEGEGGQKRKRERERKRRYVFKKHL